MVEKKKYTSKWLIFLLGALVGLVLFWFLYGLTVVNPLNSDWIWHDVTHDTAQHHLGWQFYRNNSTGGMINGLAYPQGLSMVFMDVIPLLALIFKPFVGWLPNNFQYFGLWGLFCYLLMGGLAALLLSKIWNKVAKQSISNWRWLFIIAGSLILCLSPMMIARSFYHPALAGHWLILLGFLIIIDSLKLKHWYQLLAVWLLVLVATVLIHPYFLPMLGVLMVLSVIRYWARLNGSKWQKLLQAGMVILLPTVVCLAVFAAIGGFSQGSGAEHRDLAEKGFNLLSFIDAAGYSNIPDLPTKSSSPETMMWLGLGVLLAVVAAVLLWIGDYRKSFAKFKQMYANHRGQVWLGTIACLGLLIFAMGTRIDFGSITILQYSVPGKIYDLWSAFRAAAREAWPFYYAIQLGIIWWLSSGIVKRSHRSKLGIKNQPLIIAIAIAVIGSIQAVDVLTSPRVMAKRQGFATITNQQPEFAALNLTDIYNGQKHLIALNESFRGDQSGTYVMGRTALKYGMTLNTGFFARVPAEIKEQQAVWRQKFTDGEITTDDFADNLFFTTDRQLADELASDYTIVKIDKYYIIT